MPLSPRQYCCLLAAFVSLIDVYTAVRREIKILRLFMHPHIIRLYDVVETQNDIYVVMEYVKVRALICWRRHSECKA